METNRLYHTDCMEMLSTMRKNAVNLTLTDIPYDEVNRPDNGLRTLDKGVADALTFDLQEFLSEVYRVTSGTVIIFCGQLQVSAIMGFFRGKPGTTRQIIWRKTNPNPMNGKHVHLSGIENAVWFKNPGGTYNAHCKNTVFSYPVGKNKLHRTEKPVAFMEELICDNSNPGDLVFDPCAGSGSTLLAARNLDRLYLGVELHKDYYDAAIKRLGV